MPAIMATQPAAAWPVWAGSTATPVAWAPPMPKKAAVRLWHRAREFDRRTHERGKHGGAVGPAALAVLHALIFDFWHFGTGRLDPSYAAIARAANLCERTVAAGLARLRELGMLTWHRRCERRRDGNRVRLVQQTNAYTVQTEAHWHGYVAPPEPPAPAPGTWGEPPRMLSVLAAATTGCGLQETIQRLLEAGDRHGLEAALARLGGAMMARGG